MDIVVLARMCLRRWYVVLVVFALAAAYGVVQYTSADPTFAARAQLIVVAAPRTESTTETSPSAGETPSTGTGATSTPDGSASTPTAATSGASNPLQSVQTTILALIARMQATRSVVQTADGSATFAVGQVSRGGPLLVVSATGTDRAAVQAALQAGIPAVSSQLTALQDDVGAPTDARFRAVTLQVDDNTSEAYPSRSKGLIVTLVVGLLVAVLLAVIVDAVVSRTLRRRGSGSRPAHSS